MIALTLWINFGRNDIFATVNLIVHKYDVFYHLFDASVTSISLCGFSVWKFFFYIFCCLYPWVFGGFFDAVVNGITL